MLDASNKKEADAAGTIVAFLTDKQNEEVNVFQAESKGRQSVICIYYKKPGHSRESC